MLEFVFCIVWLQNRRNVNVLRCGISCKMCGCTRREPTAVVEIVTMLAGTLENPKRQEAECLPLSRPPASMLEAASNSLPNL